MKISCAGGRIGVSVLKHRQSLSSQEDDMTPRKYKVPRTDFSNAQPFKIDGVYCKLIQLTQGQFAIVWASDYVWLSDYNWQASWSPVTQSFYATRSERRNGKTISFSMHRQILGLSHGDIPFSDHENTITLDNRRDNLRRASTMQNQHNKRKSKRNTSGYKGVSFYKPSGQWRAFIRVNGRLLYLGSYSEPSIAHGAYRNAAVFYFGEFARF